MFYYYFDDEVVYDSSDDENDELFDISTCTCNSFGRAHKQDCPLNPCQRYQSKQKSSCYCGKKETVDMVECGSSFCFTGRFHYECVDISSTDIPKGQWLCPECSTCARVEKSNISVIPSLSSNCWMQRAVQPQK